MKPIGTTFTRAEARRALKVLDAALETEEGWQLARESGAVAPIYASLLILMDYIDNSKPIPLIRTRTREELYEQQVRPKTEPQQAGASAL
jgi:hypothetical protein